MVSKVLLLHQGKVCYNEHNSWGAPIWRRKKERKTGHYDSTSQASSSEGGHFQSHL